MPPAPGMMARRVSGRPTAALDENTRKCVARASSSPPPRAIDEMAEIVGMGRAERDVRVSRRLDRKAAVLLLFGSSQQLASHTKSMYTLAHWGRTLRP